jgi:hypothetical protein
MRIGCLHTADSNIAVFEAACREIALDGVTLRHNVRSDLLAAAEQAGGLTPDIAKQTVEALHSLWKEGADVVLLTCSTLGPVVSKAVETGPSASGTIPVLRVDAALAESAVRDGGPVVALCAVETTLRPTQDLFELAAQAVGAKIEVRLIPGVWSLFKAGENDRYLDAIAAAADNAFRDGAKVVALAQASMAGAARRCKAGRPLSSPAAGLKAAATLLTR